MSVKPVCAFNQLCRY